MKKLAAAALLLACACASKPPRAPEPALTFAEIEKRGSGRFLALAYRALLHAAQLARVFPGVPPRDLQLI